ncbi:cellulase family glycosylhydrolase [Sporocytophaga myxococcoides]|nr:cellulase family glycosylhydrolase [Sporocytophaga myxococcoides]
MKFISKIQFLLLFFLLESSINAFGQYPAGSPVAINGKLKLIGNQLSNECGNPVVLRGISSHGMQWFPACMKDEGLSELANNWQIDVFRLAMYIPRSDNGYLTNPSYWRNYIDTWVDKCEKLGIYCMIDWHVLHPGDPNVYVKESMDFWAYMASKHKGKRHVIYEICNEPNGLKADEEPVEWEDVKKYADQVIPVIRNIDPSTIIIVGTPNFSQSVDKPSLYPLQYDNIMYALHFYSGSHGVSLMKLAERALSRGIALFITESGTSDASGNGGPYLDKYKEWINWMDKNKLSWIVWSFADKNESSALLAQRACASNQWNNLSESGTFIKENINAPADNFIACNQSPKVNLISPAQDTTVVSPEELILKANAVDPNGNIVKVDFYLNTSLIGTVNAPSDSYKISLADIPSGVHTIKAVATDEKGAFGSSLRTITVNSVDGLFSKQVYGAAENLFPNPSSSSFAFKVPEQVRSLHVLNLYGEIIESKEYVAPGQTLDLGSTYANGTYIMKVQYDSGISEIYRMIKVR